jgi:hypothetical protein
MSTVDQDFLIFACSIIREKITPLHYLLIHEQEGEEKKTWRYMYRDKTRNMIVRLDDRINV